MKKTIECLLLFALAAFFLTAPAQAVPVSVPAGLDPGDPYHWIFATSDSYEIDTTTSVPPSAGKFGGLNAADWNVTNAAFIAGLSTGWNGSDLVYKAILSSDTVDARDRFTVDGPIYNTNHDLIAADSAQLWSGSLTNPVAYDQDATLITSDFDVWTGTNLSGSSSVDVCGTNWTDQGTLGTFGNANGTDFSWMRVSSKGCSNSARLYGISPVRFVPSSEADPILPDGVGVSSDGKFFDPALGVGTSGPFEIEPTVWTFEDVPTHHWFDPETSEGFLYTMTDGSLFTEISDFPSGFSSPFEVWTGGSLLGTFGPGDSVSFGSGVSQFAILGIDPLVDPTVEDVFPLQLAFNNPTADFEMQGLTAVAGVPEPGSWVLVLGLLLVRRKRRRR